MTDGAEVSIVYGVSLASRSFLALISGLLLTVGLLAAVPTSATSAATQLCSGYSSCVAAGYSDAGYGAAQRSSYWRMYAGRNCTNYVAYRMIQAGMSTERPFAGTGNAVNWGIAMASKTDQTPAVGSVAWFKPGVGGAGPVGHIAYVEQVVSPTEIVVSESNFASDFSWRRLTKGAGWPSGFIHLADRAGVNPGVNPVVNTSPVTITGSPQVGQTLGSTPGSWAPAPSSQSYQWYADGAPVAGATTPTLALTSALGGTTIVLRVVAALSGYASTTADSAPVAVGLGNLAPSAAPRITASAKNAVVGTTLTADQPTWKPEPRSTTVQWAADGVPIGGATSWSYQLTGADVTKDVTAVVTARRPGYSPTPVASAAVGPVVAGRVAIGRAFEVKGPARIGKKLQIAGGGAVTPADATTSYAWRRNGTVIDGATGSSYRITERDGGAQLSAIVSVSREGWLTRRSVVTREAVVAASPRITVKTSAKARRAVVWFRVSAPGTSKPDGAAVVRVGSVSRTVTVVNGVGRFSMGGLTPGARAVTVTWKGSRTVLAGSTTAKMRVRG